MTDRDVLGGWATTTDGKRVAISPEQAAEIWQAFQDADARRRAAMPDSLSAIRALHDARTRLKDEGWNDGIYCPKDGSAFAVIEYGSHGIFSGFYSGEWPSGHLIVCDGITHPRGVLWKPIDALTDAERARLDKCGAAKREVMDADFRRWSQMAESDEDLTND